MCRYRLCEQGNDAYYLILELDMDINALLTLSEKIAEDLWEENDIKIQDKYAKELEDLSKEEAGLLWRYIEDTVLFKESYC